MKNEDIYISILKLGKERGPDGVAEREIFELAHKKGFLTDKELENIEAENDTSLVLKKRRLQLIFQGQLQFPSGTSDKRVLTPESYFRLVEHEELSDARKNAFAATIFSVIAIILALLSPVASFFIARWQTEKSVKIDGQIEISESQIQKVESNFIDLQLKLDTISSLLKNSVRLEDSPERK